MVEAVREGPKGPIFLTSRRARRLCAQARYYLLET